MFSEWSFGLEIFIWLGACLAQGSAPDETVAVAVYCPPVLSSNYMWLHRSRVFFASWKDAMMVSLVVKDVKEKLVSQFVPFKQKQVCSEWLGKTSFICS